MNKPLKDWTLGDAKAYCSGAKCNDCIFKAGHCKISDNPFLWELDYDEESVNDVLDLLPVQLDEGAFMPERAHSTDAGLDLRTPVAAYIPPMCSVTIDTGVHIQLPPGTVGMLKSKSGLNVKHGLTGEGVIDEGFTGSIVVKLYNHTPQEYYINKGDKISQLVILPVLRPEPMLVDEIEGGERGNNGFGSTGR